MKEMSEKGLGRLRKGETAENNKLEKEIIYDFRRTATPVNFYKLYIVPNNNDQS